MVAAIIGIGIVILFGLYTGYAPYGKWPKAEMLASSIIILPLIVLALFWYSTSLAPCDPSQAYRNETTKKCRDPFTSKSIAAGYGYYLAGLGAGYVLRQFDSKKGKH